jgi:hypothetical protein
VAVDVTKEVSVRIAIVITTLLASATGLHAQATGRPNTRHGLWIGFGMGDGSARIGCTDFCSSDRLNGVSGYIRVGGTLSPHLRLGAETNGWVTSNGFGTDAIWVAAAVVLWYPSRTGASYLKLGVGGMHYGSGNGGVADIPTESANAPCVTLGIGYDVRVRSRVSLVPWINVLASSRVGLDYHSVWFEPTSPPDVRISVVQARLGLTRD